MPAIVVLFALCSVTGLQAAVIGYSDFATSGAHESAGDSWFRQLGIHDGYTFATDGYITQVSVSNDGDSIGEPLELLVIEILGSDNFKILARTVVTNSDDNPVINNGVTTYTLSTPLAVSAGNTFGHWSSGSGPVPLNNWSTETEGGWFHGSRWQQVASSQIDVDDILLSPRHNPDYRDYFINVTYVPEPTTIGMLAFGGLALVRSRRRI